MAVYELVGIGILGGLVAELASWFTIRRELHKGLPDWSKSRFYWTITALMALTGGLLVWLYTVSGTMMTAILAFNVGVSAPLVLEKMGRQTRPFEPGASD